MRKIAKKQGYSETAFVMKSNPAEFSSSVFYLQKRSRFIRASDDRDIFRDVAVGDDQRRRLSAGDKSRSARSHRR
jgi:hypothetical protein